MSEAEKIIETLAERLYEQLERRGGYGEYIPWSDLGDDVKDIYRFTVEDLGRYRDLWEKLDNLASNNDPLGQESAK